MSQSTIIVPKLTIVQYEIFLTTKYFYKNPKALIFFIRLIGAGAGGGSGRRATSGTKFGGEGGCSGGTVDVWLLASELADEELVEIGAGGAGGASKTVGDTNGNAGNNGGATSFHGINGGGGRQGRGGTNAGPTSTPLTPPLVGGGTSLMFNKSIIYTSGGTIPIPEAGHCGSGDHGSGSTTGGTGGGAGTAGDGGLNNDPGDDGLDASETSMGGGSGGGGGFTASSPGGRGGIPGGGGGGGAYGDGVTGDGSSGAGGDGADGRAFIIGFG